MALYQGTRNNWSCEVLKITDDGRAILDPGPSLEIAAHSPSGFEWGFAGSGPAQLALALLLAETDRTTAIRLYHDFKWAHVAKFGDEWSMTSEQIQAWIAEKREGNQ